MRFPDFSLIACGLSLLLASVEGVASQVQVELAPKHFVGVLEGPAEMQFGNVAQVAVGLRGELFVLDNLARQVQVFDSTGAFLRTIGRRGFGPGEFQAPWRLTVNSEGWLVVRDLELQRYNIYTPDGTYDRALPAPSDRSYWDLMRSDREGFVYDARRFWGDTTSAHAVYRFDPKTDTSALSTPIPIPRTTRDMVSLAEGAGYVDQPFLSEFMWTIGPQGTVWTTEGDASDVRGWNTTGGATSSIPVPEVRVAIPPAVRDSVVRVTRSTIERLASQSGFTPRPYLEQVVDREFYPGIGSLAVDWSGHIWLRRPTSNGVEFDVLSPVGTPVARVVLPSGTVFDPDLFTFGNGILVGVEIMTNDVRRVVIFDTSRVH